MELLDRRRRILAWNGSGTLKMISVVVTFDPQHGEGWCC